MIQLAILILILLGDLLVSMLWVV